MSVLRKRKRSRTVQSKLSRKRRRKLRRKCVDVTKLETKWLQGKSSCFRARGTKINLNISKKLPRIGKNRRLWMRILSSWASMIKSLTQLRT